MRAEVKEPLEYFLPLGEQEIPLAPCLGKALRMVFTGTICCRGCGRNTSKSFNQGYCYPCFKRLAACDMCIVKPEQCHFAAGTCREPEWGLAHCFQPHIVYLANSSGLKVGITRQSQVPTRWIDQGASAALPILQVDSRLQSGLAEVLLARHVADKTHWQALLKGEPEEIDLYASRDRLLLACEAELALLNKQFPGAIKSLPEATVQRFRYPVLEYPRKIKSLSFDTQKEVSGTVLGIKGQYLLLDSGVINIRKHTSYVISLEGE